MKNGIAIMAKAFMPELICWNTTTGGSCIYRTVASDAMPRQNATGVPMMSRSVKTPKRTQISMTSILHGNEMRLVHAHHGRIVSDQQEANELFEGKESNQHATDSKRHIIEPLRDRQAGHRGGPGLHRERRAVPSHGAAEEEHQHLGDGQHGLAQALRGIVEGDLEAEMIAVAHAHGGSQQDEPAHEEQGGGLRP